MAINGREIKANSNILHLARLCFFTRQCGVGHMDNNNDQSTQWPTFTMSPLTQLLEAMNEDWHRLFSQQARWSLKRVEEVNWETHGFITGSYHQVMLLWKWLHIWQNRTASCPAIVILQLQLKLFDIINWKKDKEQDCLDGGDKIVQHVFRCLFIESQPGCWTRPVSRPISCREKPSPLAVSTLLIRFLKFQDFWFCKVVSAMVRVK